MKTRDDSRIDDRCKGCQYLEEKWFNENNGNNVTWSYSHSYCSLNKCMFSDYPDMPYQFDNMTGSMNL